MSDNLPALLEEDELALPPNLLSQLDTWEDFLDVFIEIDKVEAKSSWWRADLLTKLWEKFQGDSLEAFATQVGRPVGTIRNYVRLARAFPPGKRNPQATFSLHFQAAGADEYEEKSKSFSGEKRFEWIEKAVDEKMSTRKLHEAVKKEKHLKKTGQSVMECAKCGLAIGETYQYYFYSPEIPKPAHKPYLHEQCFENFIFSLPNNGH